MHQHGKMKQKEPNICIGTIGTQKYFTVVKTDVIYDLCTYIY